jgi:O-antigen/teichoic acid export membrane protein
VAQVAVAVFNVLINLWLIPAYSWRGAAWSSLASDGALVLAMYTAVLYAMSKEARLGVRLSAQRLEQS